MSKPRGYDFFFGIFAPDFLASFKAIATACLRLVTFLPLPDLSVPSLCSFITFSTLPFPLEPALDVFFAKDPPSFSTQPLVWQQLYCQLPHVRLDDVLSRQKSPIEIG
jgi:hypothetical protein